MFKNNIKILSGLADTQTPTNYNRTTQNNNNRTVDPDEHTAHNGLISKKYAMFNVVKKD